MGDYAASPQPYVPNRLAATPVSANLLRGGANQSSSYYGLTNGTSATDFQTGPDGSTLNATRIVGPAANWYYSYNQGNPPAGTYTFAMEVKSNTGSSQNFRMGPQSAPVTRTATTSWTTVTVTFTIAAASGLIVAWSLDGATAGDLTIANLRLFAGSADLGAEVFAGHLMLGKGAATTTANPTVSGGYMAGASGKGATAQFPTFTLGDHTVVALVRKNASGAGSGYQAILSKGPYNGVTGTTPYGQWTAWAETSSRAQLTNGQSPLASAGLWELYNQGWHTIAQVASTTAATGSTMHFDDMQMMTATGAFTATTINSILFGCVNSIGNLSSNYDYAAVALFTRTLSASEVALVRAKMLADVAANGIASTPHARVYIGEGDSISAVATTGYQAQFGPNANPAVIGGTRAIAGSTIATMTARAAALDAMLPTNRTGRKFILSVLIGRNDLGTAYSGPGGTGYAGWEADLKSYLTARRGAGWKVVLGTILPATASGFNTARNTVNPDLRSWVGTWCDAIMDFASDATIGIDGNGSSTGPWNTTYYSDGTHPTTAGHTLMEPYLRAAINAL